MAKSEMSLALKRQFGAAFDILKSSIATFLEEEWTKGGPPFDGPARATIHALQCAEYYTSRDRDIFSKLGKAVWEMADEDLPSVQMMNIYLEECRLATENWIDRLTDAGLDQLADEFGGTGFESILYAMRHLQHHAGEVCAWQKQFGHAQEAWV
jgi:uncharacterized damage-inducible protein DinB